MHTILWDGNFKAWVSPDPVKVKALTDMPPPQKKSKLQLFLGIVNYWSTFSPMTAEVCKPVRRLKAVNAAWIWNRSCQET